MTIKMALLYWGYLSSVFFKLREMYRKVKCILIMSAMFSIKRALFFSEEVTFIISLLTQKKEIKMISGVIYLLSQTTILHKYNLIMQFNKKK